MALVLEYRHTFITALDEPREPEPQGRARSLPPTPSAPMVEARLSRASWVEKEPPRSFGYVGQALP